MEAAGFIISLLAFGLSVYAIYLQFFRKAEHLFLNITWPRKRSGPGDFLVVLTNGGDLSCVVCWLGFSFTISERDGSRCSWNPNAEVEVEHESIQLKPGDHIPIVVRLPKQIPESRIREAQIANQQTPARRFFPVVLELEYVDSRGKRHLRELAAGKQSFDDHGKSVEMSIISKTIDLAKM